MEISILCDTYVRLAAIGALYNENRFPHVRSVWVECRNGVTVAIGTNVKIAAIEFCGHSTMPDGGFAVTIDPVLVEKCAAEIPFSGRVTFIFNDMLKWATAKTTFGYDYPSNALVPTDKPCEFDKWHEWLPPKMPTKTNGAMWSEFDLIAALAKSSPSGQISWPEFIDNTKPVLLRDNIDDKWIGLFMPRDKKDIEVIPANFPDWLK